MTFYPLCSKSTVRSLATGIDLIFLGTSSACATQTRNTSCVAFNYDRGCWLFDCGEGTARQLLNSPIKTGKLNKIFLTHLHGDHIYGLPGIILQTLSNKENLEIFSPAGITELLGERMFLRKGVRLRQIHKKKSRFPVLEDDIQPDEQTGHYLVYEDENIRVSAAHIIHSVFCVGYVVEEKKKPRIDADKLTQEYGLSPSPLYKELVEGRQIEWNGKIIRPSDVTLCVKGRKVVILGDTCDPKNISQLAMNADVLIHESTCENSESFIALKSFHSTAGMAGSFAKKIEAKNLILTHFSPRNFGIYLDFSHSSSLFLVENQNDETISINRLVSEATETFHNKNVYAASDFSIFQLSRN